MIVKDVPLEAMQIVYLDQLAKKRVEELGRRLAKLRPGVRADRAMDELASLAIARDRLQDAHREIQREIRVHLGLDADAPTP